MAASAFDRIELQFTKDSAVETLNLVKPNTSGSINLEVGTWSIYALGYLKIGGKEYEAAQGNGSVNVVSAVHNKVSINLQTGIFDGAPGVFGYNIDYLANVDEAVLEINPLPSLHGYGNSNTGKTIDLTQGKTGSFDLLPGYYLLTINAKAGTTMAIWNELVHIYSGQQTSVAHNFAASDFTGTVTLSGCVNGGEMDGNYITAAVVVAYSDAQYLNRIASVQISAFTKMTAAPYYYTGAWSIAVPSALAGKDVYFRIEETRNGPMHADNENDDLDTYTYNAATVNVSADGNDDIELFASYAWGKWVTSGNDSDFDFSVGADGTVTVTTYVTVNDEYSPWKQGMWINLPLENDVKYFYELEAWTESGERPLRIEYIDKQKYNVHKQKDIDINAAQKVYDVVSDTKIDPDCGRSLVFHLGDPDITGTLYLKIKSVKNSWYYDLPEPESGGSRFTATAAADGIHFKVNLRDLPGSKRYLQWESDDINDIVITNETVGGMFGAGRSYWDSSAGVRVYPDEYEVIYPYVQAGKEYTFSLSWWGSINTTRLPLTVTATGGRGELCFTNENQLALVNDGNMLKYNTAPVLSINEPKAENPYYRYDLVTGTSWGDLAAEWRILIEKEDPQAIDLLDTSGYPDWANAAQILSALAGNTCFAQAFYTFNYNDADIYPTNNHRGFFRGPDLFSEPFIHPNVVPNVLTAQPHSEGVKLTVDPTKIPKGTSQLKFGIHQGPSSAELYIPYNESDEEFYGKSSAEYVYPFVKAGETYTFYVDFLGSSLTGRAAAVTANAGLGNLYVSNAQNIGLLYNKNTKTMSLNESPAISSVGSSAKIEQKYYEWQFYKGYNWNDSQWKGNITSESLSASVVFNDTFDPVIGSRLSDGAAFVNFAYNITYEGRRFATNSITSPSFTFPHFDPAGYVNARIKTAFDTNKNLYIDYNSSISQGNNMNVIIRNYNWYREDYVPVITYAWYIDGAVQSVSTIPYWHYHGWRNEDGYGYQYYDEAYLPTIGLSVGIHYGLVIIT